jgi:hypothetical protein
MLHIDAHATFTWGTLPHIRDGVPKAETTGQWDARTGPAENR